MEYLSSLLLALALFYLPDGDVLLPSEGEGALLHRLVQPMQQPAPCGLTQAEQAGLRGPVRAVRVESAFLPGANRLWPDRQALVFLYGYYEQRAMQFDPHGFLTSLVRSTPSGMQVCAVTQQYDTENRRRLSAFSQSLQGMPWGPMDQMQAPLPEEAATVLQSFDEDGRLTEMRVDRERPYYSLRNEPMVRRESCTIAFTYYPDGRVDSRRLSREEAGKPVAVWHHAYRYERDGVTVVDTTRDQAAAITERHRYDPSGRLVEWQRFDDNGAEGIQLDLHYNEHGDVLRFQWTDNVRWGRIKYGDYAYSDYIYDEYGNWTARTLSVIEHTGEETISPFVRQTRLIIYHE